MVESRACVGIFDSGLGGLSILQAIRRELPAERLVYVADSAHAPYGPKDAGIIAVRSIHIGEFLAARGAKALVVACNTATSAAIDTLRARFDVPVVGIEPAVKPAAEATRSGVIGVLATGTTLSSSRFANLVDRFGHSVKVVVQACPGLAEQVEAGDLHGAVTRALVSRYLAPLQSSGVDVIVLGCTHYAFLLPLIRELAGDDTAILAPDAAVARHLRRQLGERNLLIDGSDGHIEFWTSGDPRRVSRVTAALAIDEPWLAHACWQAMPGAGVD